MNTEPFDPFTPAWLALRADPGRRARLRRCDHPEEVVFQPSFHELLRPFRAAGAELWEPRLAAALAVLAHVETDDSGGSFAERLGRPKEEGDQPAFSDLRFRRLLAADSPVEVMSAVTRALRLVGHTAPVRELGFDVLRWGDPVRKRWAYRYYEHLPSSTR